MILRRCRSADGLCYTQNFLQKVPHLKNSHEKFYLYRTIFPENEGFLSYFYAFLAKLKFWDDIRRIAYDSRKNLRQVRESADCAQNSKKRGIFEIDLVIVTRRRSYLRRVGGSAEYIQK